MNRLVPVSTWCALALVAASGCQSIGDAGSVTSDSLLKAASSSPDAVTLDIYWARTELDDEKFAEALWSNVQEDRLPVELRRSLADDGLRIGIVGGAPSEELIYLLNPDGADVSSTATDTTGALAAKPAKVTRRLKQLRPSERLELQSGEVVPSFPLLRDSGGKLTGRSFEGAQGIYAIEAGHTPEGRASIDLMPELHHGQAQMRYVPLGPGAVTQKLQREIEAFAELKTKVELAPGEILVVTSLPGCEHRLGSLFHHTSEAGAKQQKYLLLRLSQVPESQALATHSESSWPWK